MAKIKNKRKMDNYMNIFQDKKILITGGTGFLGRALISEILKYEPHSIRVFSRDEVKHYRLKQKFSNNKKIRNLIGNVRDYERVLKATEDVDIVIHAAALKRIDIIEYNVTESIKTNVFGTMNVAQACINNNVSSLIFVSTDKACSPLNSYGACKLLGERVITEMNYNKGPSKTILSSVRYGNVLASTGSIIPFLKEKIKNGEKIPLTHPDMTRFIVHSKEAVKLIFDALKYSVGGEVFIPVLPSMRIVDLIDVLKENYSADNEIEVIGVRPGEKIHEILINEYEVPYTYKFNGLYVISSLIKQYQQINDSEYSKKGKQLTRNDMKEYSSANYLLKKEELREYLSKFGFI